MAAGVTTLLGMGELRTAAAQALAPATDTDPYVFEDLVDNCEPPALVLDQGDPWLTPDSSRSRHSDRVSTPPDSGCIAWPAAPNRGREPTPSKFCRRTSWTGCGPTRTHG